MTSDKFNEVIKSVNLMLKDTTLRLDKLDNDFSEKIALDTLSLDELQVSEVEPINFALWFIV